MGWLTRALRVFRQRRLNEELDEELASHLAEAMERGRPEPEARRALGSTLRHRESSRDFKLLPWLEALVSDAVFGWRQLRKRPAATAAAIVSLGLAIGAVTTVFRLTDAVLLRKLPVAEPDRLWYLAESVVDGQGQRDWRDDFDYPSFRKYRALANGRAELILVGGATLRDAVLVNGGDPEKVTRQYVSGNLFGAFGLSPTLGRLLGPEDDVRPGGHPVAVLSYTFWSRRFERDRNVLGRRFRLDGGEFEIVGVGPKDYVGTEPGEVTDVFVPAMMNTAALESPGWSWFRIWMRARDGWAAEQTRQVLEADFRRAHEENIRNWRADTPRSVIDAYLSGRLLLRPAAHGASQLQRDYGRPLIILGVLVALVLLVACANVGNLLLAQAATRSREMALRVSIGAGRRRLVQMVLVESALLALGGTALGTAFGSWAAPFVVSMLRMPEDPARLALLTGWREVFFASVVAAVVTALFGLGPAWRASAAQPSAALKGGSDPRARRRPLYAMLGAQMAFCMVVQVVAGLFVTSFATLAMRPLGFSYDRVLMMDNSAAQKESPGAWQQVADTLRRQPGVESVGIASWALLSQNRRTASVRVPGLAAEPRVPYCLDVSPGFFATMSMAMIDGRDLRAGDTAPQMKGRDPVAGVGVVNQAFARALFDGQNPVGRWVDMSQGKDFSAPMQIVGYVRDAAYDDVREQAPPTMYLPMRDGNRFAFAVRTAGDPRSFAAGLRRAVSEARPGFRAVTVQPGSNFLRRRLLRERLLAALSSFFAIVALVLAAVGLYGTMNYAVAGGIREIGIRMALGARALDVVRRVTAAPFAAVGLGLAAGLAGGVASGRLVEALLFGVKSTDWLAMAAPAALLLLAATAAGVPAAMRAARVDPARTLRGD
jgi:putative ABC transport system permease protein